MQKTIYISGKITGENYYKTKVKFNMAEAQWEKQGYKVVNPTKVRPLFGLKWWVCYMISDLWKFRKCSSIYMLKDWRESRGACVEHLVAVWNKKTILYEHNPARTNYS